MNNFAVPDVPGFVVGRLLGRGGSSSVWLVTDGQTGREFALKCLGRAAGGPVWQGEAGPPDAAGEEAVRREIRILSVLDHEHLIKAHDAVRFDWPGQPQESGSSGIGLLQDLAPGGSLGELVSSRSKLTIGETVTVLTPMAQVLGYLHGKGFTHGDVSPGNVLFTVHGKPMLSDVGIARMVGDICPVADHGTAGFMDPAPVDAVRAGLQPERDVYSVAALGWYCLTGEPPARTADRPPLSLLLPDIPFDLAAALEGGLHEDRRLRPTAVEFATAVYRSASPQPVDLAPSVHASVIPQLLTRRRVPARADSAIRNSFGAWGRRITTSRWSLLFGARPVLPFPEEEAAVTAPGAPASGSGGSSRRNPRGASARRGRLGRHAAGSGTRPRREAALLALGAAAVMAATIWAAAAYGPGGPWAGPSGSGGSERRPADPLVPAAVMAQVRSPDPLEAVRGLAGVRSLAFSSGHVELLEIVNAPGSAAAEADRRVGDELKESGTVLAGFASAVSDLHLQRSGPSGEAVVALTAKTSPYVEKDRSGAAVAASGPGAGQRLRLLLVSVDGQWRISDVLPGS